MPNATVLLVDDDPTVLSMVGRILTTKGFEVTSASTVVEALKLISSDKFDVLLSDLHMPGHGDGLTVVSAMRHSNPQAVTMLFSAFPQMGAATHAILLQADEILIKPMNGAALVEAIKQRLARKPPVLRQTETIAAILERTAESSIQEWMSRVHAEPILTANPLSDLLRAEHLPQVFRDLILRLGSFEALGSKKLRSTAAVQHGIARKKQNYTAAMIVEESRILQVTIFQSLQQNLATIDFSILLLSVMTIADEVDSQLSQAMESFLQEGLKESSTNEILVGEPTIPIESIASSKSGAAVLV